MSCYIDLSFITKIKKVEEEIKKLIKECNLGGEIKTYKSPNSDWGIMSGNTYFICKDDCNIPKVIGIMKFCKFVEFVSITIFYKDIPYTHKFNLAKNGVFWEEIIKNKDKIFGLLQINDFKRQQNYIGENILTYFILKVFQEV